MSDGQTLEVMQDKVQDAGTEQREPSIRDTIQAAVKEVEAREKEQPQAEPAQKSKRETEAAADGTRDEHGRFKAKTETPAPAAQGAAQPETKSPTGASAEAQGDPLAAPATWRTEAKAKWAALDPDIKAEILKREQDAAKAATQRGDEYKQIKSLVDEIEPVLGPRKAALVQNYGSVGNAFKTLFDLSDFANRDPKGFVQWFSRQSGLDLGGATEKQPDPVDPDVADLKRTINGLQSQLQQIQGYTQQQQLSSIQSEIQAFADEKLDGKPLRPHFSKVEPEIKQLVQILRGQNPGASPRVIMQKAYDQAVYLNPEVRDLIIQERLEAERGKLSAEENAKAAAERAQKAQLASKSITGGSPMDTIPKDGPQNSNLRATIIAAMKQHGAETARL